MIEPLAVARREDNEHDAAMRSTAVALAVVASILPLGILAHAGPTTVPADHTSRRVYSQAYPTWIYPTPSKRERPLGYIRQGQSLARRDAQVVPGLGCSHGFVAVHPVGYVCLDRTATLDGSTRYLTQMKSLGPRPGPLPFHYALSNGAPMYRRLPTAVEWQHEERFLGPPGSHGKLSWGNRGHERLAEARAIPPDAPVPDFLADGGSIRRAREDTLVRDQIPFGSMVAYTRAFEHEGRTWLLSADGTVVPADRTRPFRVTTFHGVELRGGLDLPLAWMRREPRPQYVRHTDGSFAPNGRSWQARSFAPLDPKRGSRTHSGITYLPTLERSRGLQLWVREQDATLAERQERLPWGVGPRDKWIVVSITRGTLVAYEGQRPVFATLVSPGAGGVPMRGRDPVRMSTTPLGVFHVTFKHLAQTMSPDEGDERTFFIADVPHTQYFRAPFALHTAYWHDDFGEPMSAGCVNLSPIDGRWLFAWTSPALPPGWGGVSAGALTGPGTTVVVRR